MTFLSTLHSTRVARAATPVLVLYAGTALAHPGHGAPDVHAHTGNPLLLLAGALAVLGVTGTILLVRRTLRRRRLLGQR